MSSYSREQLESYLKGMTVDNCKVIDIGGSQLPIQQRVKVVGNCDFKIMDLEQPHESKQPPDYMFDIQEGDDIEKLGINRTFNIAFCIEVSEYWYDPVKALRNIWNLIIPGGLIVISFHFLYPLHKPRGKDYLRYTKYGAIKLLENAGFAIKQYYPRNSRHPGTTYAWFRSEGFRYDKEEDKDLLLETGCVIMAQKI